MYREGPKVLNFGRALRMVRKERGENQTELAKQIGCSLSILSVHERAPECNPTIARKILDSLGLQKLSPEEFVKQTLERHPDKCKKILTQTFNGNGYKIPAKSSQEQIQIAELTERVKNLTAALCDILGENPGLATQKYLATLADVKSTSTSSTLALLNIVVANPSLLTLENLAKIAGLNPANSPATNSTPTHTNFSTPVGP